MTHYGCDLSNWQGPISDQQAQEAKAEGLEFAFVLLTDGTGFVNPDCVQQVTALRNVGVLVGYYHFFRPSQPVYDQFTKFIQIAHGCGPTTLPLALDSEVVNSGWQTLAYKMMQFAQEVEALNNDMLSDHSLLYTNENFYDNLPGFPWGRWVWAADPSGTWGARQRLVWQHAPRPLPPAFPGATDFDEFVGTEDDWAHFTQTTQPLPPVPVQPEVPLQAPLVLTLPLPLDGNGHGFYTYAALGLPANANVVNVTVEGADPVTTGGYSPDDVVKAFIWTKAPGRPEIIVYGVPNGRYSVSIEWDTA